MLRAICTTMAVSLSQLLRSRPLVLDGATGTELERRGVPSPRPLWSAGALTSHPEVVEAIHRDYVAAGADVIVANTFRTNVRTLHAAGMLERGQKLNRNAIELARRAAGSRRHPERSEGPGPEAREKIPHSVRNDRNPTIVAASVAPVEDCYSPQCVPEEAVLEAEHTQMLDWLKAAKPDLIWIETMNTVREARAAARAAAEAHLRFAVSFVVREDGDLLSGERLEEAVAAVEPFDPIAIGLNCTPPTGMTALLPRLRQTTELPLVAYAHINNAEPIPGWSYAQNVTPDQYAEQVKRWLDLDVSIVGGCCGTTPAHIRAVRNVVDQRRGCMTESAG